MAKDYRDHVALYGRIRMLRSWCDSCDSWAFVQGGKMACCGEPHVGDPARFRRMSESPPRSVPSREDQRLILAIQENRCFYCQRLFGSVVYIKNRRRVLSVNWDHMVPWSYSGDNSPKNFVAACRLCNSWKGSIMFQSVDEARVYLNGRWQDCQTETGADVPGMLEAVPDQ